MGLQKLLLQPGVNTLATPTLAEGGWSESNLIRFRDGYLEKNMGWSRLSDDQVVGVCRSMHGWTDLDGIDWLALGTNSNLEVLSNGTIYDITPLRDTANVTVDFSTVSGTVEVTIVDTGHGALEGDYVYIPIYVSVGGIVIQGQYLITSVPDANTFTIDAASAATATVNNGGAVPVFDTTMSSADVDVTLEDHGLSVNDIFEIPVSTTVGGITLSGQYLVQSVADADTFTITHSGAASSTATASENSGNVRLQYYIASGGVSTVVTQGYGGGGYGLGTWGYGDPGATFTVLLRYWFLENFGVTLIACVSYGPMYEWDSPLSTNPRATLISAAPSISTAMFIAMPALQVVSLGAEVGGTQDPLLIRWSDAGDYNTWTAASTNQAGSYRLTHGSRIIGGIQGALSGLIWTDDALWQMQYIGLPFVYTFTLISHGCGLIAPLAMGLLDRDVYWMGIRGFFRYGSGAPEQLDCPVWDSIFLDLDTANMDKCICGVNSAESEVMWFFPSVSGGTGEIDSYVRRNAQGVWDYGPAGTLYARTAWHSDSSGVSLPAGVDLNNYVQEHEVGYNADGSAMTGVRVQSGYLDIEDGQQMYKVDQFVPDFKLLGTDPEVDITFHVLDHPNGSPVTHGPYTVTGDTQWVTILPAMRGRQVSVEISSDQIDSWWRLGAIRLRTAPSGRRPATGG